MIPQIGPWIPNRLSLLIFHEEVPMIPIQRIEIVENRLVRFPLTIYPIRIGLNPLTLLISSRVLSM